MMKSFKKEAAWVLKSENSIGMKRHAAVKDLLMKHFIKNNTQKADSLSKLWQGRSVKFPPLNAQYRQSKRLSAV